MIKEKILLLKGLKITLNKDLVSENRKPLSEEVIFREAA